jgi:hypothetical protein
MENDNTYLNWLSQRYNIDIPHEFTGVGFNKLHLGGKSQGSPLVSSFSGENPPSQPPHSRLTSSQAVVDPGSKPPRLSGQFARQRRKLKILKVQGLYLSVYSWEGPLFKQNHEPFGESPHRKVFLC